MYTWTITEIKFRPERMLVKPTDEWARYDVEICRDMGPKSIQPNIGYGESIKVLMRHFRVSSSKKLIGKSFSSGQDVPGLALSFFVSKIIDGGDRVYNKLYRTVAQALVKGEYPDCPVFFDQRNVAHRAWKVEIWINNGDKYEINPKWLKKFKKMVAIYSLKRIKLLDVKPGDLSYEPDPSCKWLWYVKNGEKELLCIKHHGLSLYKPIIFAERIKLGVRSFDAMEPAD